jgi:hypothetical protein
MAAEQYERHSCFTCAHYGERRDLNVWCEKYSYMRSAPESGCAFWMREPGADDEGEPPLPCTDWNTIYAQALALQAARRREST